MEMNVPYTKDSLRADLERLGVTKWDWPGKQPGTIRPDVQARNPRVAASSGQSAVFEEIAEYCWTAYEKSFSSKGDLVIGRAPHLKAANLYDRVAEIIGDQTLFDSGAQGNLLQMDKWACVVNDSWILGGAHRKGLFRLASPRVMDNLWNKDGYFVVTAREILGLLEFGYQFEQVGPWQCVVCRNAALATTADLLKYDSLVKKRQTIQQAQALIDQEGSAGRVQKQVRRSPGR
jgi:hypothetical protein